MGLFSFLFGRKSNQINSYLRNDAIILDVRTQKEHNTKHISQALHIPLSELNKRLDEIKQLEKPVIAHCASGIRSAKATQVLKSNGIDAINGGGMIQLKKKLNSIQDSI